MRDKPSEIKIRDENYPGDGCARSYQLEAFNDFHSLRLASINLALPTVSSPFSQCNKTGNHHRQS